VDCSVTYEIPALEPVQSWPEVAVWHPFRVRSAVLEPHFQVEVSTEGRKTVLRLFGELDVSSSAALEDELHRVSSSSLIVLDLRELEFIDSTGLGVLVKTHQRMRDEGDQLAVIEGNGQVKRLLELTGLDQQLTIIDSAEELLN
jgi:anti-sigma B factor antagonist